MEGCGEDHGPVLALVFSHGPESGSANGPVTRGCVALDRLNLSCTMISLRTRKHDNDILWY